MSAYGAILKDHESGRYAMVIVEPTDRMPYGLAVWMDGLLAGSETAIAAPEPGHVWGVATPYSGVGTTAAVGDSICWTVRKV